MVKVFQECHNWFWICNFLFSYKINLQKPINKWLLFDSASMTNLFSNKKLVKIYTLIRKNKKWLVTLINWIFIKKTNITRSENNITNLVSMAKLIYLGFRIYIDTVIKDAIFIFTKNNRVIKFEWSENILFFQNTKNCQILFLNSQYKNSFNYAK